MKRRQFLKAGALGAAGAACAASGAAGQAEKPERAGAKKEVPRIPRLVEPWWRACHSPELPEIVSPPGQVVDHCFFKAENGLWQLWTQIRGTAAGRLFYRWEAERGFEQPDWTPRGICWRADREAGESWDTGDEEFVHAPYVMREQGRFVMYFGGGPSKDGDAQISIATSKDGIAFTRAVNADGQSAACIGPGYARDAMVLKIEEPLLHVLRSRCAGSGRHCHAHLAAPLRRGLDRIPGSKPRRHLRERPHEPAMPLCPVSRRFLLSFQDGAIRPL